MNLNLITEAKLVFFYIGERNRELQRQLVGEILDWDLLVTA